MAPDQIVVILVTSGDDVYVPERGRKTPTRTLLSVGFVESTSVGAVVCRRGVHKCALRVDHGQCALRVALADRGP